MFQAVFPADSNENIAVTYTNSKQDISTYFNDGSRKIDFVLVYQDQAGAEGGQGQGVVGASVDAPEQQATGVNAAAQAFK